MGRIAQGERAKLSVYLLSSVRSSRGKRRVKMKMAGSFGKWWGKLLIGRALNEAQVDKIKQSSQSRPPKPTLPYLMEGTGHATKYCAARLAQPF